MNLSILQVGELGLKENTPQGNPRNQEHRHHPRQQGAGQQNAAEQNAHSLPSKLKTQLSRIPSQITSIAV